MNNNHQGNRVSLSGIGCIGLIGVGLVGMMIGTCLVGMMIGTCLGGFQFLGCLTFFIEGLTIATLSSTTKSAIFNEVVIISNVEHPLKNIMDVNNNTLVVTSLIKYTNKH
jgi:hypothetical protein